MAPATTTDVIEFLKEQHQAIKDLLSTVETSSGEDQREAFQCLVRLLAVHETAEQEVVHPITGREAGGQPIMEERLTEEGEATRLLASLEQLELGSPEFDRELSKLAAAVTMHAEHEEREEFPLLAANEDETTRQRLTAMTSLAQKAAPTHPHPHSPQHPLGNLLVGPFAAISDRVHDALRS